MEQYITKLVLKLKIELAIFFFLIILVAVLGYLKIIPNGCLVGEGTAKTAYIINIIAVALTLIGSGLAIKLFNLNTNNNLRRYTLDSAISTYHVWSIVRLFILFVAIVFGLIAYFLTFSDIGLFCALMALTLTVIYCIPTKDKIKTYIEKSQQEPV